ncbi:MAG: TonB-dependent receptor [Vicinamibacterales bacterium]
MARACSSFQFLFLFLFLCGALQPQPASAQAQTSASGVVVDEAGGAIVGARVTLRDRNGLVVLTTMSDAAGAFFIRDVPAGMHTLTVEQNLFAAESVVLSPGDGASLPLRVALKAGGFVEDVVVTARRIETRLSETPQKIEVIDSVDLERSVGTDLTDILKKNAGVDVVQYTGALSGIGLRGFRPQTSGINKRSLLLINGHPSGVTNLAALLVDGVDRIEVLKGAASAVYGSSAMGGVVNVITRQSSGKIGGSARIGAGSFGTSELTARAGGSASSRIDFDINAAAFNQRHDLRMGNGAVRPATAYKTYDTGGRLGVVLGQGWRVDGHADVYRGRDINSPPDIASGNVGQSRKDIERNAGDGRVTGRIRAHDLSFTTYMATESSHTSNVTTGNPVDAPFLPYLSFEGDLRWTGVQARDSWAVSRLSSIVVGLDYERVKSVSRSFARTGEPTAPFSADARKDTVGVYVENTLRLREGRTVVTLGGRLDHITTETLDTPLKTNFTPSKATFDVFNPSVGLKHELVAGLRAHFTVGRAFIPAEASMLTGFTTTVVGGRTQINQGNPDLKPERSTSFDAGAEWSSQTTRVDVTAFRTTVKNRFISNVVISNPPAPAPILLSVENGLDAHISGLDMEGAQRLGAHLGVFANATHYFNRKERLCSPGPFPACAADGPEQDILNVALDTIRAGADIDLSRLAVRVSGRYVRGRKDNNFNLPGFPIVNYDNFTVFDATASYRLVQRQSILLSINNVFDTLYYEKLGYPLQGASFKLSYKVEF